MQGQHGDSQTSDSPLAEANSEMMEMTEVRHVPFAHVGTVNVRITKVEQLRPRRIEIDDSEEWLGETDIDEVGDIESRHVPFDPAGTINVRFSDVKPLRPRRILFDADEDDMSTD